jgi:CheY-like chemotaxis protein
VVLSVALDTSQAPAEADKLKLHFAVRDTGIGIPEDRLDRLFQSFSQVDASTSRKYGGTGLGLAISKRLSEMMGGEMWVESQAGVGSTFHFTIQVEAARLEVRTRFSGEQPRLAGRRLLVVDDNATNRRIFERMLTNWGMRPTVVASGPEAIEQWRQARDTGRAYPLLLSDVHMPGMDGFMLTDHLKDELARYGTQVIILSSGSYPDDSVRCRELGVAAYLTKPIRQSELLDSLLSLLGGSVAAGPCEKAVAAGSAQAPPARRLHVLLAEDSPTNQKLVINLLERWGHQVTVAQNGREAVAACAAGSFDLVLMDVEMPHMDGYEATAAIRAQQQHCAGHVPIIAMTAHAMQGDREHCLSAGMDGYIPKPIRKQQLQEILQQFA